MTAPETYDLHGERRRAPRGRRLARREPAVRAARAPRSPRRQERLRAGRVRLVLGAGRRPARLLVPGARRLARSAPRSPPSRRSPPTACSPTCSRPSSTPAPCSAASAPRAWSWPSTTCSTATPHPPSSRCARPSRGNLCRCTGYGRVIEAVRVAVRRRSRGGGRLMTDTTLTPTDTGTADTATGAARPRIGESAARPDGIPKVQGRFAYSSDLWAEGMLWGHTLRSPHPSARIRSIDIGPALRDPRRRGRAHRRRRARARPPSASSIHDQPVFASDVVRYEGEADRRAWPPTTPRRPAGPPRPSSSTYEVADPARRRRGRHRGAADPPRRQRRAPPRDPPRRPVGHRRRRRRGHLRGRHAGPGPARHRGRAGRAHRRRRHRALRRDPVAPRRPGPGRGQRSACPPEKVRLHARRRRRRVRGPRGRQPPDPPRACWPCTPAAR